ncbi:zinc finger BED domain-containing DAYSLEEPER-like [Brachionus plicatilis]|uniref:Zinc finger BED domain-containing DAYSLEEPER-like n=1 Tax=Brachionus plicatilis TaxID=10195 RepID=A0A3M7SYM6_BRAPC|nr:zinc finger BED domain-containing DAYSLEEPER-like [Brachionus plicatilis]
MERMISKITNTKENDEDELSTFLKQPPIIYSNEYDILQWWKENNKDLRIMAQIAKDFLSLMPTSVPSEKCFSIGTITVDKNRTRLYSNTLIYDYLGNFSVNWLYQYVQLKHQSIKFSIHGKL